MNKTDLLFGFGAGLLIAASVLGAVDQLQEPAVPQSLTREQLEKAAQEMKLVVLSQEELDHLQQEKKVSLEPVPVPPKRPSAPEAASPEKPQTSDAAAPDKPRTASTAAPRKPETVSSEAKAVSAVTRAPAAAEPKPVDSPVQPVTPPVPPAAEQPSAPADVEPAVPATASQGGEAETKTIKIPYKATAESVARTLVESGILSADHDLIETLRKQDKLDRIRVGTYQIPLGASEEEIVKIIATPPTR
ncbi:DNA polymerase III subunit gamma/tau [Brevibacillus composti]|uniref:DNA polymerase III subunit gamma/tau n=1 Tax=Brevibacillus composti TaxID=2796470 RepID=A0A7T5EP17_9BACL|nr:DNA polymerase III subunit gamma/tau [Brevibacillus composti]QQE76158.1 DNA polymerase III subunit gamma/tau [Brevibacillus composti]QUO43187.1 DNA polymerase III subunit gamma/tau [Brevibacillus composti]